MAGLKKIKREFINIGPGGEVMDLDPSGSGIVMQLILQWKARTLYPGRTTPIETSLFSYVRDGGGNDILGVVSFPGASTLDAVVLPPYGMFNFIHPFYGSVDNGGDTLRGLVPRNTFSARSFGAYTNGVRVAMFYGTTSIGGGYQHDCLLDATIWEF